LSHRVRPSPHTLCDLTRPLFIPNRADGLTKRAFSVYIAATLVFRRPLPQAPLLPTTTIYSKYGDMTCGPVPVVPTKANLPTLSVTPYRKSIVKGKDYSDSNLASNDPQKPPPTRTIDLTRTAALNGAQFVTYRTANVPDYTTTSSSSHLSLVFPEFKAQFSPARLSARVAPSPFICRAHSLGHPAASSVAPLVV
jgi:hypothetical protein